MNPESIDMWREYVRMELGFIENLRRRWDILGISYTKGQVNKGKDNAEAIIDPSGVISLGVFSGVEPEDNDLGMNDGTDETGMVTENDGSNRDEGVAAQQEIIDGAIVKTVMTNAIEGLCFTRLLVRCSRWTNLTALPKIGLFKELKSVIMKYPSPIELRNLLLDHLYDLVESNLAGDAQAARLLVERHLTLELKGKAIVDGIQRANEKLLADVIYNRGEGICQVYADFVEEWCQRGIDPHLVSVVYM